jgi:hypothetical protein
VIAERAAFDVPILRAKDRTDGSSERLRVFAKVAPQLGAVVALGNGSNDSIDKVSAHSLSLAIWAIRVFRYSG